jgi:hypothetical protein
LTSSPSCRSLAGRPGSSRWHCRRQRGPMSRRLVSWNANLPNFAKAAWATKFLYGLVRCHASTPPVRRQGGSARLSLPSDAQARPVPTTSSCRADTDDDDAAFRHNHGESKPRLRRSIRIKVSPTGTFRNAKGGSRPVREMGYAAARGSGGSKVVVSAPFGSGSAFTADGPITSEWRRR